MIEDELFAFAGLSDRFSATIANEASHLILRPTSHVIEFLDNTNAGAVLDPMVTNAAIDVLNRETLSVMDGIEENFDAALLGVADMTAIHVRQGLEDESFEDPAIEQQKTQGLNKLALLIGTAAGITLFRNIVREDFPRDADNPRSWSLWASTVAADLSQRTRALLRESVSERKALSEVVKEIKAFQARGAQLTSTTARGAVTHIANRVLMQTYATSGVVGSVRYVAVLDSQTSEVCQGLSGKVWPLGSPDIQSPPRHPNCRSILMPILRGRENDPPPPSYEQWLKQRPESQQRDILGPSKFKAFRAGLGLSQMASADAALSVGQLKRLYPSLFKEAS